ncbi:MAG: head-tail connector protein [Pseudomonadota bacterium]
MSLVVVTAPAEELVSVEELRDQLRLTGVTDFDPRLARYRAAAVHALEAATQRRFLTQTLDWTLPGWPVCFRLPLAPVAADGVVSITYVDAAGDTQTLGSDQYVVSPSGPTVEIRPVQAAVWPLTDPDAPAAVTVRFTVGQAAEAVSEDVKLAAEMLVAHYFRNPGDGEATPALAPSQLPPAVEALIGAERWD